ncbi:MAG: zinc metallopeptidase, partial [Bacteroidales bacterium]|nr:zinc metallopeptidase [Bacteroidales bacterium]
MFSFPLLIIFVAFSLLSWIVSAQLKRRFKRYSNTPLQSGISGKDVAEKMLRDNGIYDVKVLSVPGQLSDHYNPATKTVNLSPEVHNGRNVAAAAVAAHECGHAVQHAKAYAPLQIRSALVPIQNVSARLLNIIFMVMFFGAVLLPSII